MSKPSNHAKLNAKQAFLNFEDSNSLPNVRHTGSYLAQYYFLPQFTQTDPPKSGEKEFEDKEKLPL